MGRLSTPHLIEAAVWFAIVAIFFGYTFEFNQPIEIYKFGATGWPRVVVLLLLLATAGNLYYQYVHGSAVQPGRVGVAESDDSEADYSNRSMHLKMVAVLLTPFIFAWLLKPVGIYFGAPFFIAAVIWLFGERRWRSILDHDTGHLLHLPHHVRGLAERAAAARQHVTVLRLQRLDIENKH